MQSFYIKRNSTLPSLRMEVINDGRHDFHKLMECIQGATVTFTMVNADTHVTKVARGNAYIKMRELETCDEQYVICYDWKARDTKEIGRYIGTFEIVFEGDIKNDEYSYPKGVLNMPIREELEIVIQP